MKLFRFFMMSFSLMVGIMNISACNDCETGKKAVERLKEVNKSFFSRFSEFIPRGAFAGGLVGACGGVLEGLKSGDVSNGIIIWRLLQGALVGELVALGISITGKNFLDRLIEEKDQRINHCQQKFIPDYKRENLLTERIRSRQ